ncbi:PAS domain S-box protein [Nodosilinea sp. LEGE 07298]|uniref:PAS domain S-box protein n=1 Tax=Nodosilinea sp. LEGE 07298 TaxID=2777970 RepID=UPI001D1345BE|nr:PAS domain S-box protein [Nodosilinea sp. LEGE 07298]
MATLKPADLTAAIIHDPLTIGPDTSVMGAIALMSGIRTLCPIDRDHTPEGGLHPEIRSSCVVVVDNDQVVGILTERDVVRLSAQQQPLNQLLVAEAMAQPVITCRQADLTDIFSTIDLLQHHHIRHLPIVDEHNRLVGLITHESLRQLTRPVDLLRLRLVQEVMTADVLWASPDDSMLKIARLMADRRVSSVVIAVPGGSAETPWQRAVGLLTERDLVQFQSVGLSLEATTAQTVMSSPVFTVAPDTSLWEVQQIMEQRWIHRVVVAGEQGELLGIVTQTSLLQAFNPIDLYTLAEALEKKVTRLETERVSLLEIRAAELERQVQERTHTLQVQAERDRLMAELASQILASLDVQVILDTTVQQARQILSCDRVNIWRFEAGTAVVVAESTDADLSLVGERIGDAWFLETQAEVYRQGRIRVMPDIYAIEMADCHRDMLIRLQTRAKILVPLLCGDELWGLLNVTEAQPRDWQPAEIDFVRSLSIQLAIALNQASTYEQLQSELQERQQAERQLRQSTERLQEAQRIAHIGSWELDLQHNTLYWSEEVFRLFEIDPQQFGASYEAFLDLVHPDDRTLVNEAYASHLRDRQPYRLVHRLQVPGAQVKYVQEQFETTYSADGTPLISRGTVQDITQQHVAEMRRDRAEAALRQIIEGTVAFTGEEFFPALARHIAEALGVRYASVSQATPEGFQVLAFFADGERCPSAFLPYDLVPCCHQTLQTGSCCHPADILALYPGNALFTDLQVDSYLGVRLQNAAGDPIGNLCIFHDAPLADPTWAQTLLSIFAARAGAELERLLTVQALETLNAELEARVTQRTTELAEREAILQDFLDNANDLIQMVDINTGRFEFVNRAWQNVLGYTPAEVAQLTLFDVLAPDCLPHCQAMLAQMRSGDITPVEQMELTFICKSGQRVVVEGNINCRFATEADGSQRPVSTRGIFRNVTTRKATEQELQRREARYRGLMEGAADAIVLADLQGNILEANQKAEALLGYSLAELSTLHFTQLHTSEELPRVMVTFAEVVQRQRTQVLDVNCRRIDGSVVPVDITASVISIDEEILVQGILRDITDRKRYETALQESQQFLQTVLDTVPLSVFWKDRNSVYLGANQRFLQDAFLGSVSELVGTNDSAMPWGMTEAEAYRADDRIVMESGEAKLGILEPQHQQDGAVIWLETNKLPLRNLEGEVVGVLGTYQDITERKNAEIALQRQLAAIEAAVNGIAILENERYLYFNSSHAKMFGYEQGEELIGQSWRMLYSPEQLERFDREILPVLVAQKSWQGEVTATRKDGTTFPEQLSLTLSTDNLLICVCQDISERARLDAERKQAEAALQKSERRYVTLAQAVPVAIFRFDLEGHCTYVNERWSEMTGKPIAFALGDRWLETIHPDDRDRSQTETQQWLQTGAVAPFQNEARILRDDGSIVWFYCQMLLETDANGKTLGYVGTLTDISDRKQSENAMRESEEKFRQLAEVVDAVFWILHLNRTDRVYVSPAYERIWGRPCSELYITPDAWIDRIHADDREQVLAAIPKQIEGTFDEEYRIVRPDGTHRWIHDRAFPIRNAQGQVYRLAGIAEDITERKRSEDIIRQQAEREMVLREITQHIRESLDLQTIFNTACDEIRACLRADRVGIFKFYPDSGYDDGEFVAESVVIGFSSAMAIRIHDHCFGENYASLYAQGRYQVVDDIYRNGLTPCHSDVLAQFQVQANLVMPLLCNHELWGLLCIHQCDAPRHWQQSEIDLGQQLANQLAIAIQQASLYEQVQTELLERQQAEATIARQLRQQTALELILQQIRQSLDLPEILAIATQQVQELLQGERVIVFQVCHDGQSHIVEEAVAPDLPRLKAMHWEDETWSQDILEHYWQGQPRIVPDVMDDIWTDCLVDYSQAGQIQSKIVAPILQELNAAEAHRWVSANGSNKLWGVLVVHACRSHRVWQPEEAQLLQQIANQLAIAIQQASLFEQLQQELTERQQAQAQLTRMNQELIRATHLKDEFLANMSHELRTPLNAILGMTEMLQEADVFGAINPQQLKALKTVERSGSHLLELINDVLDVAKIEAGQVELDLAPTAIAPLCQSSLAFVKQSALKKDIQLTVNLPADLPTILLDERRIRQVLINLLNNAVKFTPQEGQITLEIIPLASSLGSKETPYLRFAVTDTGIGITPAEQQRLFQPFVQVDSALNRQYQGTGLGLALVKRIVELHGGQVGLTSEVGVGSCFTFDLPYAKGMATTPISSPAIPSSTVATTPATAPLILLAEDNEANISTIVSYLQAKGYRVDIAHNGQEAIDCLQHLTPDLILMDIQMPGMDGLEAIGHIRRDPRFNEVPIIALTSLAMPGDRDRCLAAGATEYLSKPVRLKQLVESIQTLILPDRHPSIPDN